MIVVGMASKSQGFYSYILENNHHDVWKIIVLVLALVGIVALMWVYSSLVGTTDTSVPYYVPTKKTTILQTTDAQRAAALIKPSAVPPINLQMTAAQRRALLTKPSTSAPLR